MKVGILIDELAPGSAPKLIGQSVRGLNKLGHASRGLVLVDNKKQQEFPGVYNYHLEGAEIEYLFNKAPSWVRKIDFKFPGFSFFSLHHLLSFFVAPFVIKKKEYDIIIAYSQYSGFAGWSLRVFRKIPYLLVVWDPSPYTLKKIYTKTWLRFFYPLLYICAVILDVFSTRGARALITSGNIHHKRFAKISRRPLEDLYPACFPNENFVPYNQREKAILTYDRWDIGNKPMIFLELLKRLDTMIMLKIGGFCHAVTLKDEFLSEVKKQKLEDRIELLGPLDEYKIRQLCSAVMLHVHPNEEAFGMQTLEAAACGCCIIIPKGSGVTDLFQHGVHGYFPDKKDFSELLKYVNTVFSNLGQSEKMGKNAWETARKYTWSEYTKRLDQIIRRHVRETKS